MEGKFFIECGAYNGEHDSNTLTLEKEFGWQGILIEGSPVLKPAVMSKKRQAFFLPHCLSPTTKVKQKLIHLIMSNVNFVYFRQHYWSTIWLTQPEGSTSGATPTRAETVMSPKCSAFPFQPSSLLSG